MKMRMPRIRNVYLFLLGFFGFSMLGQFIILNVLHFPFSFMELYYLPLLVKMRTCRLKEIIAKLNQILTGYYHYYGITDNTESITAFRYNIMRSLFYCLNRRSQKKSYNWVEFLNMLDNSYPLVRPRIYVNIYE